MTDPAAKPRRGCFFYGCLMAGLLLLVVIVAVLAGLSYAKRMLRDYTDSSPAPLPTVQVSQEQINELEQRIGSFQRAVQNEKPTSPLALTSDEINGLIQTEPQYKALKGKLYVTLQGNQLKGQISVPLSELGLPFFRGRYLNGNATFDVSLNNGALRVTAQDIRVKGKPLPNLYMERIRSENLAAGAERDTRASIALEHLQDIRVQDGKLVIVPK